MIRARWLLPAIIACAMLAPVAARASVSETAVEAAFLPRFAKYVTWPPSDRPRGNQPIVLCVIGDDPFGPQLNQAAASQDVDGRGFTVRRMASAAAASGCDIAYVGGSRAAQMLAELGRRPILTVTSSSDGSRRGIIHFVIADGRVRFFIDNAQAQERGLTISSRLLALAVGVNQK